MATVLMPAACTVASSEPVIFVVEDDPDVRQSISLSLSSVDLRVRPCSSAYEFLEAYDPGRPGCLILDMRMPGMTGLQLQQNLVERGWQIPIIFVTGYGEVAVATAAMRAGAVDYLAKPFSFHHLLERVQESLKLDHQLRRTKRLRQEIAARIALLTAREQEVMQRLARGESTKVIAARLGISQKTVDNHRAKVLEKMGVENAAQLASTFAQGHLNVDDLCRIGGSAATS
jgi:FixJ family two-component response regulator